MSDVVTVALIGLAGTLFGPPLTVLFTRLANKPEMKEEETKRFREGVNAKFEKQEEEARIFRERMDGIMDMLRKNDAVILRDTIRQRCINYIQRGYITPGEMQDLDDMNKRYEVDPENNGFVKSIVNKAMGLPIRET